MKELRSIVQAYHSIDFSQTRAALATVVRVEGSSYRRAGARMLVLDDGTYLGGISGGCLEGDALRRAQKGIALHRPSVITYDTTQDDDYQIGVGLGCQGVIDVLFTPLDPDDPANPLGVLSGLTGIRAPAVVVTITGTPNPAVLGQALLYSDDAAFLQTFALPSIAGEVLQDIRAALAEGTSRTIGYGPPESASANEPYKAFIELILPTTHLVAYGGNYDIRSLLQLAKELGWDTTVVLNTARADRSLVEAATTVLDSRGEVRPAIDAYTAVVLMSHDYRTDTHNLRDVLPSPASYIGLLGPRKRAEKIFDTLAAEGQPLSVPDQQRIYAPAGLDIGAATPEEIALSILAEVRGHFAGRQGMSLRLREGSIYPSKH
jgi:xanthine/CO dehydrogenase XdhC/CoxF family maturation factor